ncbi:MAG: hypothetical protein E7394_06075 [Ruminococcaceae bacterium]|nr:hypothetical protein [Oscillospiraceae bacterium]
MKNIGNVFILGDSYSTFEGYIPEGYSPFYTKDAEYTNVNDVKDTWWHRLLSETESNLVRNSSWSGTTICHTGYNGEDYCEISFTGRFDKLANDGYFEKNKIDTFFLFGGTNDSWADSPIGKMLHSDWTKEDLYNVLPAIGYIFSRINEVLKDTRIICIINNELKSVITDALKDTAKRFGIECVMLKDIDKIEGHPTILGMEQIKNQVLDVL